MLLLNHNKKTWLPLRVATFLIDGLKIILQDDYNTNVVGNILNLDFY